MVDRPSALGAEIHREEEAVVDGGPTHVSSFRLDEEGQENIREVLGEMRGMTSDELKVCWGCSPVAPDGDLLAALHEYSDNTKPATKPGFVFHDVQLS